MNWKFKWFSDGKKLNQRKAPNKDFKLSESPHPMADALKAKNRRTLKVVLSVTLIVDAFLGVLILYLMFLHVPYFNLQHVEVMGNRRLSKAEIVDASEIHSGVNLVTIDLNEIAQRLMRHSWIRSATVYRRFPGKLIIEIDERVPRAILAANKIYYVDDQGEPFARVLPGDSVDLPLFTSVSPDYMRQNPGELQDMLRNGFNLLDFLEKTGYEIDAPGISEIRVNLDEGLTVRTMSGKLVVFGKDDFEMKLARFGRLKKLLVQNGEWNTVQAINLDFEDRALVRSDKSRLQG